MPRAGRKKPGIDLERSPKRGFYLRRRGQGKGGAEGLARDVAVAEAAERCEELASKCLSSPLDSEEPQGIDTYPHPIGDRAG